MVQNRWQHNKLSKMLCPLGLPRTLSMLSKALTNQKPMTLKFLQTTKNKGPILILSDSLLKGIKPLRLSRETYINKQCISGGNITDLTEIVNNMDDQTRYRKVLLHVGTDSVFKYDQQTLINEIHKLIKLIQSKWPAEVTYSEIIMHKNDSRKNIIITKINNQIKEKSLDWNIKILDNTNVVTLVSGHIDAEAYFDSLYLNNEKGTENANNMKFALGRKTKMQSANRDYYSRQEKPTANSKSRLALPSVVTITPPGVTYASKEPPISQRQATNVPAPADIPTAQDLHPIINSLPLLQLFQQQQ